MKTTAKEINEILDRELSTTIRYQKGEAVGVTIYGIDQATQKIEQLIKREKLQLLKEVEESVMGADIDFGDLVNIEMKRHGTDNEIYQHKVIGYLSSNAWVDVPIQSPATETMHKGMSKVLRVICCGVSEDTVYKVRLEDVSLIPRTQTIKSIKELGEKL